MNGFLVFTHDLDFSRLLALTHAAGPSVIQIRSEDILSESLGNFVLSVVLSNQKALNAGALIVIEPSGYRIRILPIKR